MYALIGKDDLSDVRSCLKDPEGLESDIMSAISDIQKGYMSTIVKGVQELGAVMRELPKDLATCDSIKDDVDALSKWADKFYYPVTLSGKVSANLTTNWMTASSLAVDMATYYMNGDYYQSGKAVGELTVIAVGKVEKTSANTLYLF